MQIENIKEGMKISNYRKLCQLLGEPIKDGTSKTAQLSRWDQYFSYNRQGNAYIITEVYETPKISNDKRRVFSALVEPLLLHYLSAFCFQGSNIKIEHSIKDWCISLGLFANGFEEDLKSYISPNGFSALAVNRTTYEIITKTRTILLSAVKRLEKEGTIKATLNTYIVKQTQHVMATPEECSELDRMKKEALQKIGANNMFAVRISKTKQQQYTDALAQIMRELHGWDSHYILLSIETCNNELISRYRTIDTQDLLRDLKCEIRRSIQAGLASEQKLSEQKSDTVWEQENSTHFEAPFYFSRIMEHEMIFLLDEAL